VLKINRSPSNSQSSSIKSMRKYDVNWTVDPDRDWSDTYASSDTYSNPNDAPSDTTECDVPPVTYRRPPVVILDDDFTPPLKSSTERSTEITVRKVTESIHSIPPSDNRTDPTNKVQTIKTKSKQKKPLQILLNGSPIRNLAEHVIDQLIAEDEYYDELDDEDYLDDDVVNPSLLSPWEANDY